ncbi:MAG: chromosome segregation protein SMC [Bacteroidota bacterium]|nr:chromosome segregation protein SMC [Candidatus Kapabacteria bacterium]MDW8220524.1 chromosome segregation protein SMC [Bacteroidota bacterium]
MYLSEIEIFGFKSFAVKTIVKFTPGLTAIVGPNGCGKTNVVDAIRWVLGEQRASMLRSDKMYDVIFNGTKHRRPLGLAEVSLTVQNNRGLLPTEYTAVTITRRLFRSGESQYLLNGTECRLRDITDLFMDTGMGPDAYSVIELKMVETILSNRTDERRRLFEEAAGVTKYKVRRREAERKLEAVQRDLARINDIVVEVQKLVRSLSRQAAKAKLAEEISAQLRSIETLLLQHEYASLLRRIHPLDAAIASGYMAKSAHDQALQKAEARLVQAEARQYDIHSRLQLAESTFVEAQRRLMSASQECAVLQERLVALEQNRDRLLNDAEKLRIALEQAHVQHAEHRASLEASEQHLAHAEEHYHYCKRHAEEMNTRVHQARAAAHKANEELMTILHRMNATRANSERAIAAIDALRQRISETTVTIEQQQDKLLTIQREHDAAHALLADYEHRIQCAEHDLHTAQQQADALETTISTLEAHAAQLQAELSREEASLEFLQGLVHTAETVQFLMTTAEWQPQHRTTLADCISIDEQYRVALTSALGEAAEYIIVETFDEAHAAIDVLHRTHKSKATFICLERVPNVPLPCIPTSHLLPLSELVHTNNDTLRNVVRIILGNTAYAPSVEEADRAVLQGICDAAVAPDGTLFRRNGLVKGGSTQSHEAAAIGRAEHIEALKKEIARKQDELIALRASIADNLAQRKSIELHTYTEAVRRAEAARNKHLHIITQLQSQHAALMEAIQDRHNDIERFTAEIHALEHKLAADAEQGQEMEALIQHKLRTEEHLHKAQETLALVEKEYTHCTDEARIAEMKYVELRSDHRTLIQTVQRLDEEIEQLHKRQHACQAQAQRAHEEYTNLQKHLETLKQSLHTLRNEVASAEAARDALVAEHADVRLEIQRASEDVRAMRRDAEALTAQLHAQELERTSLHGQLEHLQQRALEEFSLDISSSIHADDHKQLSPDTATLPFDSNTLDHIRHQAHALREQIKSIGTVNPLAAEEYDRESARLEFLESQFKDLQESERTLKQTIQEINQTAQKQFYEVFERIRTNFIHIFKTLFDEGDEADLLIDDGDPLEAPIKIIAKPRGKRPTSIDMLSGGEKTLTAIALLFAIYLVKPSPFCILDEVDAPLDDANIQRYIKLIRAFSEHTQFIMITHNKLTMEAADTLYGVTMQEEGVSKLVSVQFSQYLGNGAFSHSNTPNAKAISNGKTLDSELQPQK